MTFKFVTVEFVIKVLSAVTLPISVLIKVKLPIVAVFIPTLPRDACVEPIEVVVIDVDFKEDNVEFVEIK